MLKEWWVFLCESSDKSKDKSDSSVILFESLILAQDERWRRALSMQIKGAVSARGRATGGRVSNTWESAWKLDIASRKRG